MGITGNWSVEISSPMGAQHATAEFKADGERLSGSMTNPQGSMEFEGKVEGSKVVFSAQVKTPFPMKLDYDLTVDGDDFAGTVKAGMMGKFPIKGSRV